MEWDLENQRSLAVLCTAQVLKTGGFPCKARVTFLTVMGSQENENEALALYRILQALHTDYMGKAYILLSQCMYGANQCTGKDNHEISHDVLLL